MQRVGRGGGKGFAPDFGPGWWSVEGRGVQDKSGIFSAVRGLVLYLLTKMRLLLSRARPVGRKIGQRELGAVTDEATSVATGAHASLGFICRA